MAGAVADAIVVRLATGIAAPLEHVARDPERAWHGPVGRALRFRTNVDQEGAAADRVRYLVRLDADQPCARLREQLIDRLARGHRCQNLRTLRCTGA